MCAAGGGARADEKRAVVASEASVTHADGLVPEASALTTAAAVRIACTTTTTTTLGSLSNQPTNQPTKQPIHPELSSLTVSQTNQATHPLSFP